MLCRLSVGETNGCDAVHLHTRFPCVIDSIFGQAAMPQESGHRDACCCEGPAHYVQLQKQHRECAGMNGQSPHLKTQCIAWYCIIATTYPLFRVGYILYFMFIALCTGV